MQRGQKLLEAGGVFPTKSHTSRRNKKNINFVRSKEADVKLKTIMKKINLKLFTVLLTVVLVAGVSIFYACNKDERKSSSNDSIVEENVEKNYDAYIEELMATTGIDIYQFSKLDGIQKLAKTNLTIMEAADRSLNAKGDFSEEKLEQLENLKAAMDAAAAAGNDYQVLVLYESYCAICMTIDGFIFHENTSGVQTITFDPNSPPIAIPVAYMEGEVNKAVALFEEIEINYPEFPSLLGQTQLEILEAAIYLDIISKLPTQMSTEECKRGCLKI